MPQVIDFNKSYQASISQSIALPVAASPSSNLLTEFGLSVMQGGNVLLNASIGAQSTNLTPVLLFTILRDTTPIFTIQKQLEATNELAAISFSHVDSNVATGYYAYRMQVSLMNAPTTSTANLIGPVVLSGLSLG
ncbi:hypothetical protein [Paenibacillus sp. NFR01]|uniref:hypothetical protein n=1 Tax=Paenibacillus sp. NFR01 TaxID=1566279 RepID=UPI0008BCAF23|nr:hypothetical protein [Paenibacillus sp. NFR01]SET12980.1 hypothetical protein SAMN03159358_0800 [Paenibacillus sp. NFR01]